MKTTVSLNLRKQVTQRIANDVKKLNAHFGTTWKTPGIEYDVKGGCAGYVTSEDNWSNIHLNPVLLNENIDEMINQTTPHELAHWAEHKKYGVTQRSASGKRIVHGQRWKHMMSILGVSPDRCHTMDTSSVKRKSNKFEYTCSGCQKVLQVGPKIHKQLVNGKHRWHSPCGRTSHLSLLGKVGSPYKKPAPAKDPAPASSPKRPKPASGTTKKAQALIIYRDLVEKGHGKDMCIRRFMDVLNMTKAGATTYYYNCSKA